MTDPIENEELEEEEEVLEDEQVNPLEMSDEDVMNMAEPPDSDPDPDLTSEPEMTTPIEDEDVIEDEEESDDVEDEEEDADEEDKEPSDPDSTTDTEAETDTKDEAPAEEAEVVIDYKAEYEKITSPFKADGKQISINNAEEAIKLMQMGANYNRKMHGLKPSMKLLKMLDNNGLLTEDKLSYLIDLDKKDPEAINKLLKDANIDPLEIELDTEAEYQPKTYTVSDNEVMLDEVLERIQDTPTYADTIDVISNKWDDSSKRVLLEEPAIIEVINDHKASGIYDQIDSVVAKRQMLGQLTGLSNLEAYKQVGDELQAKGLLVLKDQEQAPPPAREATPPANVADPKLKDRKRAASSTKSAPATKSKTKFNPLSMTDEEFEKASAPL